MYANHGVLLVALGAALASLASAPPALFAAEPVQAHASASPAPAGDGPGGFDFEFGRWDTRVKRLRNPLSGSNDWVEYRGTTVVRPLLGGRANLAELNIAGPAGKIEGVSLRLYDPRARRWSMHYANLADGALTAPIVGRFERGRGEFHGEDRLRGRPIRVRFLIHCERVDRCSFEQAFSGDAGKTWEVNWIATDTRLVDGAAAAP